MAAVIHTKGVSIVLSNDISTKKARKALTSEIIMANPGMRFNLNTTLPAPASGRPFDNAAMAALKNRLEKRAA